MPRSEPVSTFAWGADTIVSVRFNPSEPDIIASTARSVVWQSDVSDPHLSYTFGLWITWFLQSPPDRSTSVNFVWPKRSPTEFVRVCSDRSIALYDLRMSTPLRKLIMQVTYLGMSCILIFWMSFCRMKASDYVVWIICISIKFK